MRSVYRECLARFYSTTRARAYSWTSAMRASWECLLLRASCFGALSPGSCRPSRHRRGSPCRESPASYVFRRRAAVVVFQDSSSRSFRSASIRPARTSRSDILIREHFLKRLHGGSFRADRFCCGDSIDPRRPDVRSFRASGPRSAPEWLAIGPRPNRRRSGGELQKFGELAPASTRWGREGGAAWQRSRVMHDF